MRAIEQTSGLVRRLRAIWALALAVGALAAVPGADASAAVISFDDLVAPGPGSGTGLPVNNQYNSQGVTFNDPSAFDYSNGPGAIPGFAHSGTVAVEPCVGVEFCTSPVRVTFTAAQQSVRVWVGFSSPLSSPLGVRLTAFNASSQVVGTANATLPASPSPTPIQTPLAVTLPSATIRSLEVSVTTGGGFTSGLAVDDVEFPTVGPPPPCDATGLPTVTLSQPPNGLVVQNNAFLLQGTVDNGGAPITSASVIGQSATTHTSQVYPRLIDADGGSFGPVSFNGLLSVGGNNVTVTATNCRGTGTSAGRQVTLSPIPPGTSFRQLGEIEVSQTVQDPTNGVPLIAASPNGVKRTFARVYLRVDGGASSVTGVSGTLNAVREDGSRPGGPQIIHSLNTIQVDAAATRATARSDLQNSLNFELPREWLDEGRLHLQLDHLEVEGAQTLLPCTGCANARDPGPPGPAMVRFKAPTPLRIWLVSIPYRTSATGPVISPDTFDVDMIASWLRRAFPSSDIRITLATMPTQSRRPVDCHEANALLTFWALANTNENPHTRFLGLVDDNNFNDFIGGCSLIGDQIGSAASGAPTSNFATWDTDGSYTDAYGSHEIAHMYNRYHPGFCFNQDKGDPDFPYPGGSIGSLEFDNQGLDAGDAALGLPLALDDWRAGWHDLMSYCDNQWPSPWTYTGILQYACSEDPNCPGQDQVSRPAGTAPAPRRVGGARAAPGHGGGLRLAVTGSLALRSGRLALGPLQALHGLSLSDRPRKSAYAIVMRGPGGRVLARYPFKPKVESDQPRPRKPMALVKEVVPFATAARRVAVTKGKRTLASVRVSAHPPTVHVVSPNGHKKLHKHVTIRWRASDPDGGRRFYTLLYSPDGKRYVPIAAGLKKQSYRVDLRQLPGGKRARFRVIATDGVRTDVDTSKTRLKVAAKSPRVLIATPQVQAQAVAGEPIQLVASVSDLQDPQFSESRIVWRSSIQGELGRGSAITAALASGTHEITATATNSAGKSGTATVTVIVIAIPPRMDASG